MSITRSLHKDCIHSVLWFLTLHELHLVQSTCRALLRDVMSLKPRGDKAVIIDDEEGQFFELPSPAASHLWAHVTTAQVCSDNHFQGGARIPLLANLLAGRHLTNLTFHDLTNVDFKETKILGQLSLALMGATNLTSLEFRASRTGSFDCEDGSELVFAHALGSLKHLARLSFENILLPSKFMTPICSALCSTACLTDLHLRNCHIDSQGTVAIASVISPTLARLDLRMNEQFARGHPGISAISTAILSARSLQYLALSCCNIESHGDLLVSAIAANRGLVHLALSYNTLSTKTMAAIAVALESIDALQLLNLSGNGDWVSVYYGTDASRAIREIVPSLTKIGRSLLTLDLSLLHFGDVGMASLAPALYAMTRLENLDLSHCGIRRLGAATLCGWIASCTNLVSLDLAYNHIGPEGVIDLAPALATCASLQTLLLSGNVIGVSGATALATSLLTCASLTHLGLSSNGLGIMGLKTIAPVLLTNKSLRIADLENNNVGSRQVSEFATHLVLCERGIQARLQVLTLAYDFDWPAFNCFKHIVA